MIKQLIISALTLESKEAFVADPESLSRVKCPPVCSDEQSSVYQLKWFNRFGGSHLFMSGGGEAVSSFFPVRLVSRCGMLTDDSFYLTLTCRITVLSLTYCSQFKYLKFSIYTSG